MIRGLVFDRLAGVALIMLLCGCAAVELRSAPVPPLPSLDKLQCCWQNEDLVSFERQDKTMELQSVVMLKKDNLTVIILDPLGKRMVTLVYGENGLAVENTPDGWDSRMSHYLLVGIFLEFSESASWVAGDSRWEVVTEGSRKMLKFGSQVAVSLDYSTVTDNERTLEVNGWPSKLTVTSLSSTPL